MFYYSSSGVEHGNLRELALARMKDLGTKCRDVRTREVGIQEIHNKVRPNEVSHLQHKLVLSLPFMSLENDGHCSDMHKVGTNSCFSL